MSDNRTHLEEKYTWEFFGSLFQHSIFDDAFLHHDFRRTLHEEIGLGSILLR